MCFKAALSCNGSTKADDGLMMVLMMLTEKVILIVVVPVTKLIWTEEPLLRHGVKFTWLF